MKKKNEEKMEKRKEKTLSEAKQKYRLFLLNLCVVVFFVPYHHIYQIAFNSISY